MSNSVVDLTTTKLVDLFILDKPKMKWVCQVMVNGKKCGAELSKSGNTSGRKGHITSMHKDIILEKAKENIEKTISIRDSLQGYATNSMRYIKLNRAVLNFIVRKNQPISLVNDPDFLEMLKEFDPRHVQRYIINKIFVRISN